MSFWQFLTEIFTGRCVEVPSPPDRIKVEQIKLEDYKREDNEWRKRIIIDDIPMETRIMTLSEAADQDTNSMDGLIDVGHSVPITWSDEFLDDIRVGDIVIWNKTVSGKVISRIHQVIEIGHDNNGWYCYTKGINMSQKDPWKIRKNEINYIAPIGVFW